MEKIILVAGESAFDGYAAMIERLRKAERPALAIAYPASDPSVDRSPEATAQLANEIANEIGRPLPMIRIPREKLDEDGLMILDLARPESRKFLLARGFDPDAKGLQGPPGGKTSRQDPRDPFELGRGFEQ
jgi:hypothetical protein